MPVNANFAMMRYEDGILTMGMTPPAPIGGHTIVFELSKRMGGDPIVMRSVASGFNGVSGITITNSGEGVMDIQLARDDLSGLDAGNYYYKVQRINSGFSTMISQGYRSAE